MSPKLKLNLLVAISIVVVLLAAIMLKQSVNEPRLVQLAWGFILTMGALTLVRGIRIYRKLP